MRHISLPAYGEGFAISPKLCCHALAALCGRQADGFWKVDIPPMLAAQAVFPSGPLAGFLLKYDQ